jgi:urea transport system ATP-binding protein
MLTVSNLHLHYGASHILRGVSIEAKPGEVMCIMGRNGVGKTSLLRAILGLQPTSDGNVAWGDQDVTRLPAHHRARLGFANVPQGRNIFARLTVAENLRTGFAAAPAGEKYVPEHVFE